jgi:hypothetical protein
MDATKSVTHFSEFSVIFYAIYKNQQFGFTIGVYLLRKGPWKDWKGCNVVLGAARRRGLANSGEAGGAPDRGRGGGWLGVC